ncbi:MAG: adenosylcobinamide-phosphate synthase CbiB [Bacteroidia bacterium]|nr:adenosylcobinamide-phosphate synthase CbiB [Bacteroidia bacterium]
MSEFIITYQDFLIPLIGGLLLDAALGDPRWLPHPIRFFGNTIALCDQKFNRGKHRKEKGVFVALALTILVWSILYITQILLKDFFVVKNIVNTLFFFYAISNRSLITEALKVEREVQKNDLLAARKQLGWIVGRDTSQLSFHQIRTATLETLAENLSDGIIAPMFFYALGGVPLMMAYKMVNTMDSMIGYKNDRYKDFGWFAARILDDGANYLPARLTAFLMVLFPPSARGFRFIRKYARQHTSPNSGYPESALAGVLKCRFGGPNVYNGKLVEKPYIGENNRELTHDDIIKSCFINIKTSFFMMLCVLAVYCVFYLLIPFIA